jgi:hypothetical protein
MVVPENGDTALPDTGATDTFAACPSNSICFKDGRAQGLMTGAAWANIGDQDTLESPTCGINHETIDYRHPCADDFVWPTSDRLCVRGRIPSLPLQPISDAPDNWGANLGVNAAAPNDSVGALSASYKNVAFTFSGTPNNGLRAIIHRKGDPAWVTYCMDGLVSNKALVLTKFSTKCWGDTSSVDLAPKDVTKIDQIGVEIPSRASDVDLDFCLTRITFQ